MKTKYVECECQTVEHLLRFIWDEGDKEDPYMYVDVCLNSYGFFKRFWYGIKYIFGFKTNIGTGQFDVSILRYKQVEEVRNLCNEWLDTHKQSKDAPLELQLYANRVAVKLGKEQIEMSLRKIEEIELQMKNLKNKQ